MVVDGSENNSSSETDVTQRSTFIMYNQKNKPEADNEDDRDDIGSICKSIEAMKMVEKGYNSVTKKSSARQALNDSNSCCEHREVVSGQNEISDVKLSDSENTIDEGTANQKSDKYEKGGSENGEKVLYKTTAEEQIKTKEVERKEAEEDDESVSSSSSEVDDDPLVARSPDGIPIRNHNNSSQNQYVFLNGPQDMSYMNPEYFNVVGYNAPQVLHYPDPAPPPKFRRPGSDFAPTSAVVNELLGYEFQIFDPDTTARTVFTQADEANVQFPFEVAGMKPTQPQLGYTGDDLFFPPIWPNTIEDLYGIDIQNLENLNSNELDEFLNNLESPQADSITNVEQTTDEIKPQSSPDVISVDDSGFGSPRSTWSPSSFPQLPKSPEDQESVCINSPPSYIGHNSPAPSQYSDDTEDSRSSIKRTFTTREEIYNTSIIPSTFYQELFDINTTTAAPIPTCVEYYPESGEIKPNSGVAQERRGRNQPAAPLTEKAVRKPKKSAGPKGTNIIKNEFFSSTAEQNQASMLPEVVVLAVNEKPNVDGKLDAEVGSRVVKPSGPLPRTILPKPDMSSAGLPTQQGFGSSQQPCLSDQLLQQMLQQQQFILQQPAIQQQGFSAPNGQQCANQVPGGSNLPRPPIHSLTQFNHQFLNQTVVQPISSVQQQNQNISQEAQDPNTLQPQTRQPCVISNQLLYQREQQQQQLVQVQIEQMKRQQQSQGRPKQQPVPQREDMMRAYREIAEITTERLLKQDQDGHTMLHLAVIHSEDKATYLRAEAIIHRLKREEQLDKVLAMGGKENQTPLCLAVFYNHSAMVRLLLECGADPNVRILKFLPDGINEYNLLHFIACKGSIMQDTLEHLLNDPRTDVNVYDSNGLAPLHWAVRSHRPRSSNPQDPTGDTRSVIYRLAKRGADLNIVDRKSGRTPLHYAIEKRDRAMVDWYLDLPLQFFIQPNPSPTGQKSGIPREYFNIRAFDGMNALDIAHSLKPDNQHKDEMIKLLQDKASKGFA